MRWRLDFIMMTTFYGCSGVILLATLAQEPERLAFFVLLWTIAQGLLTLLLGYAVLQVNKQQAEINKRQADTSHQKLKLDLFERRFQIYEACRRFVVQVTASWRVTNDQLQEFRIAVQDAQFLFEPPVTQYVKRLGDDAVLLRKELLEYDDTSNSPEKRQDAAHRAHPYEQWFAEQLHPGLRDTFDQYLSFKEIS